MRISDLKYTHRDRMVRASAIVTWENCDHPDQDIFIETDEAFGEDISCNPHSFLVGCFLPAMHLGEKRISLDAEICPTLQEGLETAMALMKEWSNGIYEPLKLEVRTRPAEKVFGKDRRAGLFLSGGMDSLAALRINRMNFPEPVFSAIV